VRSERHIVAVFCILGMALAGCRGTASDEPPIVPIRNMYQQPRYNAQGASDFFQDGRAMRPLVDGTIAREMDVDPVASTGWSDADQSWALTIPSHVVDRKGGMDRLLARGQDRFNIYCTPCHGYEGDGQGLVARRVGGAMAPPTFHSDRVRHLPDGQIFATITYGVRNMPMYRHSIPEDDRWAIVGYVRALQLSRAEEPQAALGPEVQR
jgi:mono/diheme cytochrome c family protein